MGFSVGQTVALVRPERMVCGDCFGKHGAPIDIPAGALAVIASSSNGSSVVHVIPVDAQYRNKCCRPTGYWSIFKRDLRPLLKGEQPVSSPPLEEDLSGFACTRCKTKNPTRLKPNWLQCFWCGHQFPEKEPLVKIADAVLHNGVALLHQPFPRLAGFAGKVVIWVKGPQGPQSVYLGKKTDEEYYLLDWCAPQWLPEIIKYMLLNGMTMEQIREKSLRRPLEP